MNGNFGAAAFVGMITGGDAVVSRPASLQVTMLDMRGIGKRETLRKSFRRYDNPKEEIRNDRLREELFYLLNVFPIMVPPLRQRAEDIAAHTRFSWKMWSV